jgi:alpha-glucosidase (family GH31 glycosyl hydrolase)
LNVHPSQGIRFYEDCYHAACERMGIDPTRRELIPFQITDPKFLEVYFDLAHHPMEDEGVDFWWLDWQQGTVTDVPGLDPLWALNHYHTLDHARNGKRSLILSRYAGLGSHRYPLGFSGDTFCTWRSLDFQPYFTNTAANAGYTWWSHDIGGHQKGRQDDELYLRWLQYGVFSPIHRLHSSNSDFMGKEPWKRCWAVSKIAGEFMRLRHKLIPYLYSANYETHTEGTPICMPMYYLYQQNEAYETKNQYIFGGQLLVCPITKPMDRRLNLANVRVWLPEGRWTDCFTGRIYRGGQWVSMYRDLDSIPVLAPAGAIVPMYQNCVSNDLSLDQPLDIDIWRGNGTYRLYEDDGETTNYRNGASVLTTFILEESGDSLELTIQPGCDQHGLLPEQRNIRICFRDIKYAQAYLNGASIAMDHNHSVAITLGRETVSIKLEHITATVNPPKNVMISDLLTRIQAGNDWKSRTFKSGKRLPGYIRQAITEFDALLYE